MELFNQYLPVLTAILQIIGALTVVATFIVRLTSSKADDEVVGKVTYYWLKISKWLPTIGVNPQTKKLEEQIEELKKNESA